MSIQKKSELQQPREDARTSQSKQGMRSLSAKIMSATLGMLAFASVLWLGSGEFYFTKLRHATDERDLAREIHLRLLETRNAENRFMLRALRDPDFYEQGTSEDIQTHQVAMRRMQQQIRRLGQVSSDHDMAEQLLVLVGQYDENFASLNAAYRTRGFKDWGLIGKFREAVHSLESGFSRLHQQALTIEILQLRRSEKDYLLRREPKYSKQVFTRLTHLRTRARNLEGASSAVFQELLDDYVAAFHELLRIDKKIGVTTNTGLHSKIHRTTDKIQPLVAKMVIQANDKVNEVQHQSAVMAMVILFLGTVVAMAIGLLVSRSMTRPLVELLHATERVAKGDYRVSISSQISARDEIGMLARSFENMAKSLQRVAHVADEISLGNYSVHVPSQGENDVLGIALANMTKTLREKTEEDQRKTEELEVANRLQKRFRSALDVSADAIFLIDRNSMRFIDMNKSACVEMGYTRDELLAMGPQDIKPNITETELMQKLDEILESQEGLGAIETIHRRKDGSTFPVEVFLRALKSDGRTIFVASVRDHTEREQSEAELASLNSQLVTTARQAGKAEVATSVLHNVGNVLNSVNVSAGVIQDKVYSSGTSSLTKAVGVMEQHLDDLGNYVTQDERGKHLPRFLADLSKQMVSDEERILEEVRSLIGNIDHIKSIVATQQSYATGTYAVVEEVSLADLLEDAIHINTASMRRHSVEINRQFDDLAKVAVDKQKFLQIVVNLISNAKYACIESGNQQHELTVSLRRSGEDRMSIEVRDNGMGIAAENLTKIFAHGFTTRKEGHGFGLHSAALAAKELGGSLTAESEGTGTGATFTLEIPCKRAEVLLGTS